MSNISEDNFYQLFHSVDGDLEYDGSDESSNTSNSSQAQDVTFDSMDLDVKMDRNIETIEQANFSGLGLGGTVPEKISGPSPEYPNNLRTTFSDSEIDIEWNSMIKFSDDTVCIGAEEQTQVQTLELPVRTVSRYVSFPCLLETELREAADTVLTDIQSNLAKETEAIHNAAAESLELNSNAKMDTNDDFTLAAAKDAMSLEPAFWHSASSDSSDNEDDTTFANDGWANISQLQPRSTHTVEVETNQQVLDSQP